MRVGRFDWLLATLTALMCATQAQAQGIDSRVYVGILAGPYHTTADHVDGTLSSIGVTGGIRITPWLDLEVDVLHSSGVLSREHTGPSIAFGNSDGRTSEFVITRYIHEREGGNTLSIGASFHPRVAWGGFTPRLFAGISSHRTKDRIVLEHLSVPPGVTVEQVNRAMPQQDWRSRHLGGPSFGGSLGIAVTQRLSVVPDLRYDYGSMGDEINNALRTSIRVLWRF